jgi:hypothetical protein
MEHHTDSNSGILGWAIFAISFIGSFLEPLTDGLKFIAALTAAVIGVIKLIEWWREKDYKKRKKGGI